MATLEIDRDALHVLRVTTSVTHPCSNVWNRAQTVSTSRLRRYARCAVRRAKHATVPLRIAPLVILGVRSTGTSTTTSVLRAVRHSLQMSVQSARSAMRSAVLARTRHLSAWLAIHPRSSSSTSGSTALRSAPKAPTPTTKDWNASGVWRDANSAIVLTRPNVSNVKHLYLSTKDHVSLHALLVHQRVSSEQLAPPHSSSTSPRFLTLICADVEWCCCSHLSATWRIEGRS